MYGCGGGNVYWTYKNYTSKEHMALDCKYKYVSGGDGDTRACTMESGLADKDSVLTTPNYAPSYSVEALKDRISIQPVAIAVNAGCNSFYQYSSGVYDTGCGTALDHAVVLVGYSDSYYILRNSWGTSWGDGGYMKIAINGDGYGVSGCQMDISYPTEK